MIGGASDGAQEERDADSQALSQRSLLTLRARSVTLRPAMILLIDNYDSFTWNLVQRIGELDASIETRVVRNDAITPEEAQRLRPTHVIISPGPCTPSEAGVSSEIIRAFAGRVPVLGVCLGHQCIGSAYGMCVRRHDRLMHGKTSEVHHRGVGVFRGLSEPFIATRYHSLVIAPDTVPNKEWEITAWTNELDDDGRQRQVVMGVRRVWDAVDAKSPLEGVQFHPESFLTKQGPKLLANFLEMQ